MAPVIPVIFAIPVILTPFVMTTIIFALLSYLIGSISFAVVISRLFKLPDPRTFGSKNPGATNVLRTGKRAAAVFTLLGDAAKGWLAVFLALHFAPGLNDTGVAICLLAVFLGHAYPVFFGFQGGKGVATALGILLALDIGLGVALFATWLTATLIWRVSSLSALIAAICAPLYAGFLLPSKTQIAGTLALSILLIWRHQSNIRNLLAGKETRIGKPED